MHYVLKNYFKINLWFIISNFCICIPMLYTYIPGVTLKLLRQWGWRNDLAFERTQCSCRGPSLVHRTQRVIHSCNPVAGNRTLFLTSIGFCMHWYSYTNKQNIFTFFLFLGKKKSHKWKKKAVVVLIMRHSNFICKEFYPTNEKW